MFDCVTVRFSSKEATSLLTPPLFMVTYKQISLCNRLLHMGSFLHIYTHIDNVDVWFCPEFFEHNIIKSTKSILFLRNTFYKV